MKKYQTLDLLELIEKTGVRIIFQNWAPVTFGEFNHQTKTIYVNNHAKIEAKIIIAHELGHYFLKEFLDSTNVEIEGVYEESICDAFAESLLKNEIKTSGKCVKPVKRFAAYYADNLAGD